MTSAVQPWASDHSRTAGAQARQLWDRVRSAAPAAAYGLRLWTAVCLALYVAFWLELDNAYWAGLTAAIVCQPSLGASLRKALFYVVGTAIGAVAIVALTACFPQDRVAFLVGLALWSAACGFVSSVLRNFAAFAAALAGFTAAIVAGGELGATGGASEVVFMLALTRASEVCIGIVSATIVLSWTDFGAASRRLAAELAAISVDIAGGIAGALSLPRPDLSLTLSNQRDLVGRVNALDRVIDEAIGESSNLRLRLSILQAAVGGLFAALSGLRMAAAQLERLRIDERQPVVDALQRHVSQELESVEVSSWMVGPLRVRRALAATVRALTAPEYRTPSLRLLADQTAETLMGVRRGLDGVVLLADPSHPLHGARATRFYFPDWLPCVVNSIRIFVTVGAVELFWVVTAWPTGAQAITFSSIYVFLLTLQGDRVHSTATDFLIGVCLTAASAAIVKFAVLPQLDTFGGLSLALGLVLVPAGTIIALPWRPATFVFLTLFIEPLVAPENQMAYDTLQFYNLALAIVAGLGSAALAFRLAPPLSPGLRARRLVALTSRDLQRLTKRPAAWTAASWRGRICSRLSAMPAQADPSESAQLLTVLSMGTEIIRLRSVACRFHLQAEVDAALHALAQGDRAAAADRLSRLDGMLAKAGSFTPGAWARLRSRGSILAIAEAVSQLGDYSASGAAR